MKRGLYNECDCGVMNTNANESTSMEIKTSSPEISSEISGRRKGCVMSVLVAQHRGLNMDLIAEVSRNISDKGVAWALTLGRV